MLPKCSPRWILALFAIAATACAVAAYQLYWKSTVSDVDAVAPAAAALPLDPRLTYNGPFRNLDPGVKYVGDAACANCHFDVTATYEKHPMGRSMTPIAHLAPGQVYDAKHQNPFDALGRRFLVIRQGDRVTHREMRLDDKGQPIYEHDIDVHFAIGSGTRGYSYVAERDGRLFQTPISWFAQRNIWDLSPGFKEMQVTSRPINGECMFCHANQAFYREESVNHFDPPHFRGYSIGCERCHGPGERHAVSTDKVDIVNPRRLSPSLRDAVCQQCHLEGAVKLLPRGRHLYDFRPGLPLDSCWSIFVRTGDSEQGRRAINHVEQMQQSACFQRSGGENKLGCISCHDPHVKPDAAERASYFRSRCLECHQEQACQAPARERREQGDSCMVCHMPRFDASDVAHTASTNHRIPRHKNGSALTGAAKKLWPDLPITLFHEADPRNPERERDLGIALMMLMAKGELEPLAHSDRALKLLQKAIERDPDDVDAWQARGHGLILRQNKSAALEAFESILTKQPNRESALIAAAATAQDIKDDDRALRHWRRAVELNPWMPDYRPHLANLLIRRGNLNQVRRQADEWVQLAPGNVDARMLLVNCLVRAGQIQQARAEFAKVEALRPPNLDELRLWFGRQNRE